MNANKILFIKNKINFKCLVSEFGLEITVSECMVVGTRDQSDLGKE